MILPNLFIPGAAKSGTSTLHEYLNQHPDVYMSDFKEPQFFSHDTPIYGEYGYRDGLEAYSNYFISVKEHKVIGESSTSYMMFPNVIERIKENIENPKFIFILRNPIDRAYSNYTWLCSTNHITKDFRTSFQDSMSYKIKYDENHDEFGRYFYFYHNGLSAKWINEFYTNFGKENVHVIIFEEMLNDKVNVLNRCFDFLDIDPVSYIDGLELNKSLGTPDKYKLFYSLQYIWKLSGLRNMNKALGGDIYINNLKQIIFKRKPVIAITDKDRKWLAEIFYNDVKWLRDIVGMPISEWNKDFYPD